MTRTFWLTVLTLVFPGGLGAQSVHRFYEDEEVVFKPELVGKLNLEGGTLEFRDLGDKSYGITLQFSPQSAIYFRARLFCVNDRCFLDGQVTSLKWREEEQDKTAEAGSPEMEDPAGKEFQQDKGDFLLNRAHGRSWFLSLRIPTSFWRRYGRKAGCPRWRSWTNCELLTPRMNWAVCC